MKHEGYTKGKWIEDGDDIGVIQTYSDEESFIPICSMHTPHLYNTPEALLEEEANKKLLLDAPRLAEEVERLSLALKSIAEMVVNEYTDHAQLSALCIFVAKTALEGGE